MSFAVFCRQFKRAGSNLIRIGDPFPRREEAEQSPAAKEQGAVIIPFESIPVPVMLTEPEALELIGLEKAGQLKNRRHQPAAPPPSKNSLQLRLLHQSYLTEEESLKQKIARLNGQQPEHAAKRARLETRLRDLKSRLIPQVVTQRIEKGNPSGLA